MLKKILNITYWTVFTILILVSMIVILSSFTTKFKFLTVQSGSMESKIKLGSLVVIKESTEYKLNDIITFRKLGDSKALVTHRIIGQEINEDEVFVTKGDANEEKDNESVNKNNIVGKVVLTIPLLGYVVSFIKKPFGTIFFLIIPATIFVTSQVLSIKEEITKLRKDKALL